MGFGEAIATCFRKYFTFSGRAVRSEYWWFYLFTIIGSIVSTIMDYAVFGGQASEFAPINSLFSLAVFFPTIAAASRRLHDTNCSGWWQLIPLAPLPLLLLIVPGLMSGDGGSMMGVIIGLVVVAVLVLVIMLIVRLATIGTEGSNKYGDDPLGSFEIFD